MEQQAQQVWVVTTEVGRHYFETEAAALAMRGRSLYTVEQMRLVPMTAPAQQAGGGEGVERTRPPMPQWQYEPSDEGDASVGMGGYAASIYIEVPGHPDPIEIATFRCPSYGTDPDPNDPNDDGFRCLPWSDDDLARLAVEAVNERATRHAAQRREGVVVRAETVEALRAWRAIKRHSANDYLTQIRALVKAIDSDPALSRPAGEVERG